MRIERLLGAMWCLSLAAGAYVGCGRVETEPSGSSSGTGGATSSASVTASTGNCANAGCAPPPFCPATCTDPCGCCGCGQPGTLMYENGAIFVCEGSCWAAGDGGSCTIPECLVAVECAQTCGGPVVFSSCCPCPQGTVDVHTCADGG